MIVNTPKFVVQSNKLIEARYTLTTGEQRLVLAMVSKISKDDEDFHTYEISFNELSYLLNMSSKNIYHEMKKITVRLMQRILHVKDESGLVITHWVSFCRHDYKNKIVYFRFDPFMKPYLLKLKSHFTVINLSKLIQFQSMYSVRIYQLLCQYKKIGWRQFRVDELREILGLKENQYKEYKDFNKWILNQAKKEFEEKNDKGKYKSDISFKIETAREGRKIAIIKFIIIQLDDNEVQPFATSKPKSGNKTGNIESDKLDKKLWSEFIEYIKENDTFMYNFYLENGGNAMMVQGEYYNFLEKWEEEQKRQQV